MAQHLLSAFDACDCGTKTMPRSVRARWTCDYHSIDNYMSPNTRWLYLCSNRQTFCLFISNVIIADETLLHILNCSVCHVVINHFIDAIVHLNGATIPPQLLGHSLGKVHVRRDSSWNNWIWVLMQVFTAMNISLKTHTYSKEILVSLKMSSRKGITFDGDVFRPEWNSLALKSMCSFIFVFNQIGICSLACSCGKIPNICCCQWPPANRVLAHN